MMKCDVCNSDKDLVGVASSSLGPISFCYCRECAVNNREPELMFVVTLELIGTEVADYVKQLKTIKDGVELSWSQWVDLQS